MSHKTMVDGVSYEIGGGKTLVNGTAYSIDKGKTLVGGTAYEVGFGPAMCTVTVTHGSYETECWECYCCAEVDGQTIYFDEGTYELPIGTVIYCEGFIYHSKNSMAAFTIRLNEQEVARAYGYDNTRCSYEFTLSRNTIIDPHYDEADVYYTDIRGVIDIIEQ